MNEHEQEAEAAGATPPFQPQGEGPQLVDAGAEPPAQPAAEPTREPLPARPLIERVELLEQNMVGIEDRLAERLEAALATLTDALKAGDVLSEAVKQHVAAEVEKVRGEVGVVKAAVSRAVGITI